MTQHPGVEVVELDAFPTIESPGTVFSGLLARSQRGRDDVVTFLTNLDQYEARYGGPDANNPYGWESVRDYFEEGGKGLFFVRVVGNGAAKATKSVAPLDDTLAGTYNSFEAGSVGAWGNNALLTTQKYSTVLTANPGGFGQTFVVASITGFEIGDVIKIDDGVTVFIGFIVALDAGTKTVTVASLDASGAAQVVPAYVTPANAVVTATSTHKAKTTLAAPIVGTANTQIQVSSAALVDKGALLVVVSSAGDRVAEFRVTQKNGNILTVTTVTEGGNVMIPAGSVVVSINFTLQVQIDGNTTPFVNLNLESADSINYAGVRLAESDLVDFVAGTITGGDYRAFEYPEAVRLAVMTGGADGSAPVATDYLGTTTTKAYQHGVKLFDNVDVLPQFGATGMQAADFVSVHQGLIAYAEGRADTIAVLDAPVLDDTLDELLEYRNVELNAQTSYAALYAPWLREDDALTPGALVDIPPTGKVLGTYSEVSVRRGTQKPPANEQLNGVRGLTTNFSDEEFGILNSAGVNLIRNVSGRGTRIMGARTLWPVQDRKEFVNVRRVLNAIKIGLRTFAVDLVQEPNDEVLWAKIQNAGNRFLADLHGQGWFVPRDVPSDAFFFVCDKTTNTEALRLAAKVRAVLGVNPVLPGEIIRFELALFDGGLVNVNEL